MVTSNKNSCFSYTKLRHYIPNFYFKINKTHIKDDLNYYNIVNYLLYNIYNICTIYLITFQRNVINCFKPKSFLQNGYFLGSPYDWPGTVVRELGQTINKYVMKKNDKIKNLYRILVSGKFSTNLYVKSTCFAKLCLYMNV